MNQDIRNLNPMLFAALARFRARHPNTKYMTEIKDEIRIRRKKLEYDLALLNSLEKDLDHIFMSSVKKRLQKKFNIVHVD